MKKILLISLILFISTYTSGQQALSLEYKTIYGAFVIKPTWNNLTSLLFESMTNFRATMEKYEYKFSLNKNAYVAKNDKAVFFYTLSKETDNVVAAFITDDFGLVPDFRKEIRSIIKSGNVTIEKGFETYFIETEHRNFKYKLKIGIKEDQERMSMIIIQIL